MMTGLHGIHVLIGIGLIFWIMMRAKNEEFGPEYFTPVELVGLYWHFVDLVWIYLFPLLYLIR
jgi:cytochrome c oxidase subunit 3